MLNLDLWDFVYQGLWRSIKQLEKVMTRGSRPNITTPYMLYEELLLCTREFSILVYLFDFYFCISCSYLIYKFNVKGLDLSIHLDEYRVSELNMEFWILWLILFGFWAKQCGLLVPNGSLEIDLYSRKYFFGFTLKF